MASKYDWTGINPEDVKKHVDQHGASNIKESLKKSLKSWEDVEVNIGITGDPGAGKSSYINAIREVDDGDLQKAAEVGVTETTLEPACYDHPTNPKIKFWDLPGFGTPDYPHLETYCNKVKLETYDAFLIFTKDRFTESDKKLAMKIRSIGKRFFFIRAKIDQDVDNEKRKLKQSFDERAMLEKIKSYCLKNLVNEDGKQLSNEQNIFLISNRRDAKMWDFDLLTQAILDALPTYQRESLILSLGILSPDVLQRKVQVLRGRLWKVASLSAAAGVVPLPGVAIAADLKLIMNEISFYKSQLGIPDEGSPGFEMLSVNTQTEVKAFCLTMPSVSQLGLAMAAYASEQAAEEVTRFIIPLVGLFVAGAMSFVSTYLFLKHCLEKMEKTAVLVHKEAFQSLQKD